MTVVPAFHKTQAETLQRVLEKKQQLNAYQKGLDFREHRSIAPAILLTESIGNCLLIVKSGYTANTSIKKNILRFSCFWGSPSLQLTIC